jgi:hypothetical protein
MPVLSTSDHASSIRQHSRGLAWRAGFATLDLLRVVLPIPFAAKVDAERCCAIMRQHVPHPHDMTLAEFNARFAEIGGSSQESCDLMVAQSCRW